MRRWKDGSCRALQSILWLSEIQRGSSRCWRRRRNIRIESSDEEESQSLASVLDICFSFT